MNVLIAAVSSNPSISGVSRHAANLVKCLLIRTEILSVHVLVSPWEEEYVRDAICRDDKRLCIHRVQLRPGTLRRNAWYYDDLPSIAVQLRADVVHLAYPSPIRAKAFRCPVVVTLHDLYPYDIPSNFGYPKVFLNRMILRQCLSNASAIACVSQTTRQRLQSIMPHLDSKSATICNFAENCPKARKPSFAASWSDRPFLLCVAQHRRNKNVPFAVRVFKRVLESGAVRPDARFVVVGLPGPESGNVYRTVSAANLREAVVFVDGLADSELSWCYRHCELLLAPSSIEGFGLPVLEAQLAGARVVCSDIPAFREVASADCRFVGLAENAEPRFAEEVVACLRLRRPSPVCAPRFSPVAIAARYVDLYTRIVDSPRVMSSRAASPNRGNNYSEAAETTKVPTPSNP